MHTLVENINKTFFLRVKSLILYHLRSMIFSYLCSYTVY